MSSSVPPGGPCYEGPQWPSVAQKANTGLHLKVIPRFGEFCSCFCWPLLPQLAAFSSLVVEPCSFVCYAECRQEVHLVPTCAWFSVNHPNSWPVSSSWACHWSSSWRPKSQWWDGGRARLEFRWRRWPLSMSSFRPSAFASTRTRRRRCWDFRGATQYSPENRPESCPKNGPKSCPNNWPKKRFKKYSGLSLRARSCGQWGEFISAVCFGF